MFDVPKIEDVGDGVGVGDEVGDAGAVGVGDTSAVEGVGVGQVGVPVGVDFGVGVALCAGGGTTGGTG